MKINIAYDIVESKGYIDVVHNNKAVWIEQINEDDNTALVKEINTEKNYLVPLSELKKSDNQNEYDFK